MGLVGDDVVVAAVAEKGDDLYFLELELELALLVLSYGKLVRVAVVRGRVTVETLTLTPTVAATVIGISTLIVIPGAVEEVS